LLQAGREVQRVSVTTTYQVLRLSLESGSD
jgi:hypothetical protein